VKLHQLIPEPTAQTPRKTLAKPEILFESNVEFNQKRFAKRFEMLLKLKSKLPFIFQLEIKLFQILAGK
jgi:hypothetical protein